MSQTYQIQYFLGANSPQGFYSLYDQLLPPETANAICIIKGGPGCGKSTLMRQVAAQAAQAGVDGLILPDVPFEEKEEFAAPCREHGLVLISMVAPTSEGRVAQIAREAEGFLYCVSSMGVTGVRSQITTDVGAMVALAKQANPNVPCAIGFGISPPEQAAAMGAKADGVIVGSAIVKLVGQHGRQAVEPVREFVRQMKQAL